MVKHAGVVVPAVTRTVPAHVLYNAWECTRTTREPAWADGASLPLPSNVLHHNHRSC